MKIVSLEENYYYHIYNRGINGCTIFGSIDNYDHFIRLFKKHLIPEISVLCFCLIRNHFHFIVRIGCIDRKASQKFSNLFNAYAKYYNRQNRRTGSLFERPFKRKCILDENYLKQLILYVHTNPIKHEVCDEFQNYPYSSYSEILYNQRKFLPSNEIIELFGDKLNFQQVHLNKKYYIKTLMDFEFF